MSYLRSPLSFLPLGPLRSLFAVNAGGALSPRATIRSPLSFLSREAWISARSFTSWVSGGSVCSLWSLVSGGSGLPPQASVALLTWTTGSSRQPFKAIISTETRFTVWTSRPLERKRLCLGRVCLLSEQRTVKVKVMLRTSGPGSPVDPGGPGGPLPP